MPNDGSSYNGTPLLSTRGTRAREWLGNLRARRAALGTRAREWLGNLGNALLSELIAKVL